MLLIIASSHHTSPTPLKVNLGTHVLLITSGSGLPDPFLAGTQVEAPVLFDNEEAYKLCVCLETLFRQDAK